jgi:hypothetical protein
MTVSDIIDQTQGAIFASDFNKQLLLRDAYIYHVNLQPSYLIRSNFDKLDTITISDIDLYEGGGSNDFYRLFSKNIDYEEKENFFYLYRGLFGKYPPFYQGDLWEEIAFYENQREYCNTCVAPMNQIDQLTGICSKCVDHVENFNLI